MAKLRTTSTLNAIREVFMHVVVIRRSNLAANDLNAVAIASIWSVPVPDERRRYQNMRVEINLNKLCQ